MLVFAHSNLQQNLVNMFFRGPRKKTIIRENITDNALGRLYMR